MCTRLTDLALTRLVLALPILVELNLNGVKSVSTAFTSELMRCNQQMRWLDLVDCRLLTIQDLRAIKAHYTIDGRKFQLQSSYMLADDL